MRNYSDTVLGMEKNPWTIKEMTTIVILYSFIYIFIIEYEEK
jgi:hypothetical protein